MTNEKQKPVNEKYRNQWDLIFRNAKQLEERAKKELEEELFNGMTEEETNETASVKGLSK